MPTDEIRVTVVAYADRKHLMMRYLDPITKKQIARSTGTTVRREAERLAAKWEAELKEGRYHAPRKISWEAFRDRYEDEVLPGLAEKTTAMVSTVFNAVERILHPERLDEITADRLSYFQAELRDGGRAEPTIRTYLAHLASALNWAVDVGFMSAMPKIQKPKRAKGSKIMKGRPITAEEFERMLAKAETIVGAEGVPSWQYYLRGLWWSGLRLGESLVLTWDRQDRLCVDMTSKRPMLWIPGELEKGNKDRLLPMAPEFAEFLSATPEKDRKGHVFRLHGLRLDQRPQEEWVSNIVARIGKAANVKVNTNPKTGKVKFASAHDLRRSFGERWARRVMPQVLKELMRHESIETTMKYYVGRNAQMTADALWDAYKREQQGAQSLSPTEGDRLAAARGPGGDHELPVDGR